MGVCTPSMFSIYGGTRVCTHGTGVVRLCVHPNCVARSGVCVYLLGDVTPHSRGSWVLHPLYGAFCGESKIDARVAWLCAITF